MPFYRASQKLDTFPQANGDLRVMAADYTPVLGFFRV